MTHHTPGSSCGPAGQTRAAPRISGVLAAGLITAVTLVCGALLVTAHAAQNTEEIIFCGTPLARQLMPGGTNTFKTSLLPGTVVSTDIIDTDNINVLKLQAVNFSPPATATCSGELLLTTLSGAGTINVTDCFDSNGHNYTIGLSVVSQGPDNCAVPLQCGIALNTAFATAGQVGSYTFPGVQDEEVSLAVTNLNPPATVRLRLFDPTGAKIYDDNDQGTCPGSLRKQLPQTGTYTALISRCTGSQTGGYTVTWQPPMCPPKQPPGQFAYVANADSGTLSVIDLSTNTARLGIPITPPGRAEAATPTYVAITPNGGFAWATYGSSSTTSLVNTSTNLLMAAVPTGLDTNGLAISADGAIAYVLSNSLGGVALIDPTTNRVTRVAALDPGAYQGLAVAASSDDTFLYVIEDDDNNAGLVKISIQEDYLRVGFVPLDLGIYDAFAVSPDGSFIYAGFIDGIAVIDTTTLVVTQQVTTIGEPFAIAFTPDGRTAYATIADDGVVAAIDTASHTVTKTIPVTDNPGGIAINPETLLAYVTDFAAAASEPGVFVLDTRTNKVIASTPAFGDGPSSIALTTAPTGLCVGDAHGETMVTVNELVQSVNYLLDGCPGRFPSLPFP